MNLSNLRPAGSIQPTGKIFENGICKLKISVENDRWAFKILLTHNRQQFYNKFRFYYSRNPAAFLSLTLRQLMLYIHMEHLFLMFLDHTQRRTTDSRTPLDKLITRSEESYWLWCVVGRPLTCWDRGFESHRGMDICLLWLSCLVR